MTFAISQSRLCVHTLDTTKTSYIQRWDSGRYVARLEPLLSFV
jgi:hypothetical protein